MLLLQEAWPFEEELFGVLEIIKNTTVVMTVIGEVSNVQSSDKLRCSLIKILIIFELAKRWFVILYQRCHCILTNEN